MSNLEGVTDRCWCQYCQREQMVVNRKGWWHCTKCGKNSNGTINKRARSN